MNNGNNFSTPVNSSGRYLSSIPRSTIKRDSFAAELEGDPHLSTAKRQQRTQAFSSHLAHASLERQLVAAQSTKSELETKLREKDILIDRLESDRRWLAEREKEEREEKERERVEYAEEKRKAESELKSLRRSHLSLKEELADLKEEHSELRRTTSSTISAQKAQITTLTHQISLMESELSQFQQLVEERARAFDELQLQFDELSAAQDSLTLQNPPDEGWTVVREELHRQASYMRQLEGANAKMNTELVILREKQTSVEVLKEQKRELERRLRGADELRETVVKLEAELDAARQEREEWASSAAAPSTPSKTPVSVTESLSSLRLAHARLMEEHGSNVALLRHREQELSVFQTRDTETQELLKDLRAEVRACRDIATRSEHKVALAEREISFLQAMLASYSAEEAAHGDVKSESDALKPTPQLEVLLKDYKAEVSALESELKEARAHPVASEDLAAKEKLLAEIAQERAAKTEVEKELKDAEAEAEKHLEQIDELEQTLFELRGEIGAGRHLPPGTRVLCLKDNPAQQWEDLSKAAMDRLRNENEALLKRLKDLEHSGVRTSEDSASQDLVPLASWEALNEEKSQLQAELKQKEKRLLRLQQVFSGKSKEFRDAIESILGVKLAFYPNGQVRVTSQYDLNAAFVFQPNGQDQDMKMQLIAQGDGGPEDLPQLMRYWVEQEQCIPGFLASITLQCYEKCKMLELES